MQNEPTPQSDLTYLHQYFTFWFTFFKKSKDKQMEEFEDNLKEIATFNTAEEFWGIYQHMKRPDALPRGCEFFLFKKGIRPLWEDMSNVGGGRFFLSMKKSGVTNKVWEDLLIAMILLKPEDFAKINGVVLNVRTSEVIMSIWTKALTEEELQDIKVWLKEVLDLPNEQIINYKKHPTDEQLLKKQEELVREEEERKKKLIEMEAREMERKAQEEEEERKKMEEAEQQEKEESEEESEEEDEDDYFDRKRGLKTQQPEEKGGGDEKVDQPDENKDNSADKPDIQDPTDNKDIPGIQEPADNKDNPETNDNKDQPQEVDKEEIPS